MVFLLIKLLITLGSFLTQQDIIPDPEHYPSYYGQFQYPEYPADQICRKAKIWLF